MKILVAVDLSEKDAAAIHAAANVARAAGGELILVNVFSPFVDTGRAPGRTPEERRANLVEERHGAVQQLIGTIDGAPGRVVIESREKTEEVDGCIARVAGAEDADMVVVASKHASELGGRLLGSTALGLLGSAPCPVLVVRPG